MKVSSNELRSAVYKAACGTGLMVGLAEDVARSMAWLTNQNASLVAAAVDAVVALDGQPFLDSPAWASTAENELAAPPHSVAVTGPVALDLLLAGDAAVVHFETVEPTLLVALVGQRSQVEAVGFTLSWQDRHLRFPVDDPSQLEARPRGPAHLALTSADAADASRTQVAPAPTGLTIGADRWSALSRLGARTYVPASEASRRAGAGAG